MAGFRVPLSLVFAASLSLYLAAYAAEVAQTDVHPHMASHGADQPPPLDPAATAFLKENDEAMARMMAAMEITPSGDVDRDFVEMMVPHHQGAIDMAQAILRRSHNEKIRRIAQEIIVTQQQEITAMRLAIGDPLPASQASPTQIAPTK
jgi:uncharacterized protein (DUF305 family)